MRDFLINRLKVNPARVGYYYVFAYIEIVIGLLFDSPHLIAGGAGLLIIAFIVDDKSDYSFEEQDKLDLSSEEKVQ